MHNNNHNCVLIFPPLVSPAYIPLGVASLAAYIRQELSFCNLRVFDLNIDLWNSSLEQHPACEEIRAFLKNTNNTFYNEEHYRTNYRLIWQEVKNPLDDLHILCKLYLENDELAYSLKNWLDNQTARILAEQPASIGFSVVFPQQLFFALALARYIKEQVKSGSSSLPPLKVFLGGATMSAINSSELLAGCHYIDAIVLGEGEEGFKQLLTATAYEMVPGLLYRKDEQVHLADIQNIRQNPAGCVTCLHNLPIPDFTILPLHKYFSPQPVLPVLFSRGCRWRKCRFCAHNFSFNRYRHKTVEDMIAELEYYRKLLGIEHFYFADQYLDTDSLEVIADEILKQKLEIYFHFMGRPTGGYSPVLLEKLFHAGCRWISWGVETGSQRLLDIINKGTSRQEILRILNDTHACGINNLAMMIFGLPTSTETDLNETFDFLQQTASSISSLTESEFILYKHTPFANEAAKYGLKVIGEESLFRVNGFPVHSHRLFCQFPIEQSGEIDGWRRRKPWVFSDRIYDKLIAEHYLLYASHLAKQLRYCS